MIISGAWAVETLPDHYVVEIPMVGLRAVQIVPFRKITDKDLLPYEGRHPRRLHGSPIPIALYKFYGLEKSDEVASETLHLRVTPTEKTVIGSKANAAGYSVSEYLRKLLLDS